jgi:hypothetical protein
VTRMIMMNNGVEKIWKETVVVWFKAILRHCLEWLRKAAKILCENRRSPSKDLNPDPAGVNHSTATYGFKFKHLLHANEKIQTVFFLNN